MKRLTINLGNISAVIEDSDNHTVTVLTDGQSHNFEQPEQMILLNEKQEVIVMYAGGMENEEYLDSVFPALANEPKVPPSK